ncbi:MAG: DUF72 domain-containing protein [Bryobacteraceae bacterium]|nr:DUF72 domain-containing protein [Bryobacteraceae bacterium]
MATLYAGTSGFAYPAWKPGFYPDKLPAKKFLSHYGTRLNAVEANYTFRRLPTAAVLEKWVAETPAHFRFALKAHQRITHIDRLAVSEFTGIFFRAIDGLRVTGRLGPVLVQLPPNLMIDTARLEAFLAAAPDDIRLAFEFRHKSWFEESTYEILARHEAALCLAESEKIVVPERLTAPFVYFRLRKEEYSETERQEISDKVRGLVAGGRDVYAFFKHEDTPAGALHAEELLR